MSACKLYPCSDMSDFRVEMRDGVEVHVGFRHTRDPISRGAYRLYGSALAVRHEAGKSAATVDYVSDPLTGPARIQAHVLAAKIAMAQKSCVDMVLRDPKWWDDPASDVVRVAVESKTS